MSAVAERYRALVGAGELRPDPDQEKAVAVLDRIAAELAAAPGKGPWARWFGKAPAAPRGAYLWGGVGRGKSMLMDLAFAAIPAEPKRRVHFHEFMIEVHERLRVEREKEEGDPIPPVARALAAEARLLAFDEMVINNAADAMILSRLFGQLLEAGVTVVTTSNRPPGDLYLGGLNRELFLPFIALVERALDVVPLNGPTDYRLERLGGFPTWYVPNGPEATRALSEAFFRLTDFSVEDRAKVPGEDITVQGGRTLHVPKSLKGVAVFSFKRLCGEARGAADYLAIARRYHTVILVGIPVMGPDRRNEAARFVTLIDTLYEHKVKLLAAADAGPDGLYPAGDGAFEFQRTVSRLIEMQSQDYLAAGHGIDAGGPSLRA
ncbi:MAG: cell division protein ZapE [Sphingomonadales bacterium]|nr:cell division protein ZapE [Sphingomonadales bacterium]